MGAGPPHESKGESSRPGGDGSPSNTTSGTANSEFHRHLSVYARDARRRKTSPKSTGPVNPQAKNVQAGQTSAQENQSARNAVTAGKSFASIASKKKIIEPLFVDTYADQIDPREKTRTKPSPIARNGLINRLGLEDDQFDQVSVSRRGPSGFQYLIKISLKTEIDVQRYQGKNFFRFGAGGTDSWFGRLRGVQGDQIESEAKEKSVFVRIEDELPSDVTYGLLKAALARADVVLRSKIIQSKYQKAPENWNESIQGKWRLEGKPDGRHHFYAVEMDNFPTSVEVRKHKIRLRLPKKQIDTAESLSGEEPEVEQLEDNQDEADQNDEDQPEIPSSEEIKETNYNTAIDAFKGEQIKLEHEHKVTLIKWMDRSLEAFYDNTLSNDDLYNDFFEKNYMGMFVEVLGTVDDDESEAINSYKTTLPIQAQMMTDNKIDENQFKHIMFFTMMETLVTLDEIKIGKAAIANETPESTGTTEKDAKNERKTSTKQDSPGIELAEKIFAHKDFKKFETRYKKIPETSAAIQFILISLGLEGCEEAKKVDGQEHLLQSTRDKIDHLAIRAAARIMKQLGKPVKEKTKAGKRKKETPEKAENKKIKVTQTEEEEELFSDKDLNDLDQAADELIAKYKVNRKPLEDHSDESEWDKETTKYWMLQIKHQMTFKRQNNFIEKYKTYDSMCERLFDAKNLTDGSVTALTGFEISASLRLLGKNVALSRVPRRTDTVSQKILLHETLKGSTAHLRALAIEIDKEHTEIAVRHAKEKAEAIKKATSKSSDGSTDGSSNYESANSTGSSVSTLTEDV